MYFLASVTQTFWTILSLFQFSTWPSASSLIANLEDASAKAESYEEWLQYQEELDAVSGASTWSVQSSH